LDQSDDYEEGTEGVSSFFSQNGENNHQVLILLSFYHVIADVAK
jgi:hypothetical protein